MDIFKHHPLVFAIITFFLVTLPSIIDTYWDLYQKITGASVSPLNLGFWIWLLPLIGAILAVLVYWRLQQAKLLDDIKTDLVNMNTYQREMAIKKTQQVCPKEVAMQIYDDFIALFGKDILEFAISLIQRTLSERSADALIEFFKKFGDILDSNQYGLKVELEENELYKAARMDLAQKRIKLKVRKRKGATIQKNIDRVCSLTYGLNSSILLRGILSTEPSLNKLVPAEIRVAIEGIETETEKTLTTMLNDLKGEWKVTINGL